MTTTELIQWATRAQAKREESWSNVETRYKLTLMQSILDTAPKGATKWEADLCYALNEYSWNEVQEWEFQISKQATPKS